jgi:hypothetical protein
MRSMIAVLCLLFALTACNSTQVPVVQSDVTKAATAIAAACQDANTAASAAAPFAPLTPVIPAITLYVQAGCGTADAIAALVAKTVDDPTTVAWAENLATELNSAIAAVKKL